MGHRVPFHESKCKHPHGHRYKVEATVEGDVVPEEQEVNDSGMVMDFGFLKTIMTEHIHDRYDHAFVYWDKDPIGTRLKEACVALGLDAPRVFSVDFVPTAERLAKHFFETLDPLVQSTYGNDLRLQQVKVWETPTSTATFDREEWDAYCAEHGRPIRIGDYTPEHSEWRQRLFTKHEEHEEEL